MTPVVLSSSGGGTGFSVVIDPDDTPLDISDGSSYRPIEQITLPDWPLKSVYAGSFDTHGSLPASRHMYDNGELIVPLRVYGTSAANLLTQLGLISKKVAKINRCENHGIGGEIEITFPSGNSYRFDAVEAKAVHNLDQGFVTRFRVPDELRFVVLPGARGAEEELATSSGNGVMVFLADALKGELPGLGRLVVGATSQNQAAVHVGVQSEHYDAASTAALAFNGTDLTPLGTSTDTGSAIRNTDLIPTWQAIGSTEIAGVGHMTQVGDLDVWVRTRRPTGNTGEVSLRLSYAQGVTFRNPTTNPQVDFDANEREGVDCWVSLGQVHLPEPVQGTTKWLGRFEAKSTVVGDEIDIKAVRLLPVAEGHIELSGVMRLDTPSSISARDGFVQPADPALTGQVLPAGGTWTVVASSDADDFSINSSGGFILRTIGGVDASDVAGRYVSAGTTSYGDIAVYTTIDPQASSGAWSGVFARLVDIDNWLQLVLQGTTGDPDYVVRKRVGGGSAVELSRINIDTLSFPGDSRAMLLAVAGGRWSVWATSPVLGLTAVDTEIGSLELVDTGYDSDLVGTLATGKIGVYGANTASTSGSANWGEFLAFPIVSDEAIFSGRELELRHNTAVREETTADEWATVSVRDGNYLRIPAAGMEGRQARIIVASYRNDPDTMGNDNDDALTATLYGTPVYLSVPEP